VAGVYLGMDFNDGKIYGLYNGKLQSLKLFMGKYIENMEFHVFFRRLMGG
jgi:hypothetical protein